MDSTDVLIRFTPLRAMQAAQLVGTQFHARPPARWSTMARSSSRSKPPSRGRWVFKKAIRARPPGGRANSGAASPLIVAVAVRCGANRISTFDRMAINATAGDMEVFLS